MKVAIIFCVLVLSLAVQAASEKEKPSAIPVVHKPAADEAPVMNVSQICYEIVLKDLGDEEWNKFVMKAQQRYQQWTKDYDIGDMKRFLDDRLIQLAPGVVSGKGQKLKEFACWVALYDFFYEPVPAYISDLSEEDRRTFHKQLQEFDWDRCALIIKEKHSGR